MLTLDGVHTYYGKSHILHGVSIEVKAGEVVGLLGRNGVGKTTTLKTVMGLVRPAQGAVTFEGRSIGGMAPHHLAHLGIAWVPEERRIFRLLTVMENLRTGLDRAGVTEAKRKTMLDKIYASFPVLAERQNQAGGTLSGGEQQMLAIARAMMLETKIILLDEPTEGLMPRMVGQISEPRAASTSWKKVWCDTTHPPPTSAPTTRSSTSTWESSAWPFPSSRFSSRRSMASSTG